MFSCLFVWTCKHTQTPLCSEAMCQAPGCPTFCPRGLGYPMVHSSSRSAYAVCASSLGWGPGWFPVGSLSPMPSAVPEAVCSGHAREGLCSRLAETGLPVGRQHEWTQRPQDPTGYCLNLDFWFMSLPCFLCVLVTWLPLLPSQTCLGLAIEFSHFTAGIF